MDPETKEIMKTNKLTELKRWAASPKSFTLDFGDYESDYYTVVTLEGEAMSQVMCIHAHKHTNTNTQTQTHTHTHHNTRSTNSLRTRSR